MNSQTAGARRDQRKGVWGEVNNTHGKVRWAETTGANKDGQQGQTSA